MGVLTDKFDNVVSEVLAAHSKGLLASATWPAFAHDVGKTVGLSDSHLYRSLRLAITGKIEGPPMDQILQLLQLLESGAPWSDELLPLDRRMAKLQCWLSNGGVTP